LFFNSNNVMEICERMHQILTDEALQIRLKQEGFKRSAQFSWDKCGRETLDVYNSVLGVPQLK
jgi:glycosyltransferase involved in cell wall biosynthesis